MSRLDNNGTWLTFCFLFFTNDKNICLISLMKWRVKIMNENLKKKKNRERIMIIVL